MTDFILQAHSGWRWIVLALLVITAVNALLGWLGKRKWRGLDARLLVWSRMALYVQLLLGIALYVLLQKWDITFTGSHVVPAILTIGCVEFSAARSKKTSKKFMVVFVGFALALLFLYGTLAVVGGLFPG